jgi:hypothetical protein
MPIRVTFGHDRRYDRLPLSARSRRAGVRRGRAARSPTCQGDSGIRATPSPRNSCCFSTRTTFPCASGQSPARRGRRLHLRAPGGHGRHRRPRPRGHGAQREARDCVQRLRHSPELMQASLKKSESGIWTGRSSVHETSRDDTWQAPACPARGLKHNFIAHVKNSKNPIICDGFSHVANPE